MYAIKLGTTAGLIFAFGLGYQINNAVVDAPEFPPLRPGVDRICIAGFPGSPPTAHAHFLADKIAQKFPQQIDTYYYWSWFAFYKFLEQKFGPVSFDQIGCPHLKGHDSSPFVWIERNPVSAEKEGKKPMECIGGDDKFIQFVNQHFTDDEIVEFANTDLSMTQAFHASKAPATAGKSTAGYVN